jgi:hypothetical protein
MADRETKIANFFETTTASLLPAGNTNVTLSSSPGFNAILGDEDTWFYLVIDPDQSGSREVIVVKESTGASLSVIERDLETSYAGTGPDHQTGTTVRLAVLKQHFEDMNDRLDTGIASLTSALQTSDLQDDDTFASAAADKVASSESIKAYVDTQDALKLSLTGGTMTGAIVGAELTDYVETDVSLSSTSGVVAIDLANGNTGSLTLTENVTSFEFTNIPTSGVSSFTLKVTQDASSAYTVAINDIDINAPTLTAQTAKTAGAGGFTMTATLGAEDLLFFLFFNAGIPYLTAQQEMS